MEETQTLRVARYLDASALAKLNLDCSDEEPGREALRKYFNDKPKPFYTTPTCFAETIGILKRKHFYPKKGETPISEDEYIKAYEKLLILVYGEKLTIEEVNPAQPDIFQKAKKLVQKYKIDFGDVMQIATLLHGRFSHFCAGSQSLLITADKKLTNAAREEGADAWYCIEEAPPD